MTRPSTVGFAACVALVVANMVGTGIFTSLGFQLPSIPSHSAILLLWLLGGVLSLCGALCYAELSSALPRSGGEYHFLSSVYHPAVGFMAGMVSIVVGFAAPVALSSMAFGSYLQGVFPGISATRASVAIVVIVTLFHLRDLRISSIFQIFFTIVKIALVLFLSVALLRAPAAPAVQAGPALSYVLTAPFAVSLMFTLYAYSGWNAATYILDEVKAPWRTIPVALVAGTLTVTILYLCLNHAFLHAAPAAEMAGRINVAQIAAGAAFGPEGGRIVAAVISLGLVSAISAMIWAGPRVAMVIGDDYPRMLGWLRLRNRAGLPVAAVLAQSMLSIVLLLTATFEQVLLYTQFALLACSFLAVLGVIVLRRKRPDLPRPFRVPLYPLTPLLFMAISAFAMIYTALDRPWAGACGLLTLLAGLGVYAIVSRGKNSRAS